VYDLATRFGIARQTAAAILERHGIKRRFKVLTAEMITIAISLYESGTSLAGVGNHFDVDAGTIRKALLDAGVKTRPVGTNQWK
jgi:hypothetical protein